MGRAIVLTGFQFVNPLLRSRGLKNDLERVLKIARSGDRAYRVADFWLVK
jgi:hypothetical protein